MEYPILGTRKDGVQFQSIEMQRYNNDFVRYTIEYQDKQQNVVDELIKISSIYS